MKSWYTLLILPTILALDDNHGVTYRVTPLKTSTGLYYEHLGLMKRAVGTWRVTSFLNIRKVENTLRFYEKHFYSLTTSCAPEYQEYCEKIITGYTLLAKFDVADNLRKELSRHMAEMERRSQNLILPQLPNEMKRRRATPLLGIIGGVIGPITGLLTYNDGQAIEEKISELEQVQANISHLVGKQTHVIRAQMDNLHEITHKNQEMLKLHKEQLSKMSSNVDVLTREVAELRHTEMLARAMHAMDAGLDDCIRLMGRILDVIHTSRQGKMHISLLTSEQLEPIYRDVQDHHPRVDFPVSGPQVDIEELATISTVTTIYKNEILNILLDIPLLEPNRYLIYQLHPVSVSQSILRNGSGRAYVQPKFSHMAVGELQRTYISLNQRDVDNCKKLPYYVICSANLPLNENTKNPACESELLLNPDVSVLRSCDVRITYKTQPEWTTINTMNGWLYSLPQPIFAKLTCSNYTTTSITLEDIGLIQIAPGCQLRANDKIFYGSNTIIKGTEVIYEPLLHLDLTKISPIFEKHLDLAPMIRAKDERTEEHSIKDEIFVNNERSLDQIEEQLFDLNQQRQTKATHTMLIHGSYLSLGSLLFGLFLYFCRFKIMALILALKCCTYKKKRTYSTGVELQPATPSIETSLSNPARLTPPKSSPRSRKEENTSANVLSPATKKIVQLPVQSFC